MKSFESDGVWYLPGKDENPIAGKLRFDKRDKIRLSLTGTFQGSWTFNEIPRYETVFGILSESPYGKIVTLRGCFSSALRFGAIATEELTADHAYIGDHHVESEPFLCNMAILEWSALNAWFDTSGFQKPSFGDGEFSINWKRPEVEVVSIDGAEIHLLRRFSTESRRRSGNYTINEDACVKFKLSSLVDDAELHHRWVHPFSTLIDFVTRSSSSLDFYQITRRGDEPIDAESVNRIFVPAHEPREIKEDRDSFIFRYSDIKHRFAGCIHSWYTFRGKHPDFCAMYFPDGHQTHGFVESRFVSVVLALEYYLREEFSTADETGRLASWRREVLALPSTSNLEYSNYYLASPTALAFPALLKLQLRDVWNVFEPIANASFEEFLEAVFEVRGFAVHREHTGDSRAMSGEFIFWLTERLKALIDIVVLKHIGFADDEITHLIRRSSALRAPTEKPFFG